LAYLGWRLLIHSPSVQNTIQMTTSASLDISPSFSPDGNSFVYSSNRTGSFQLYVRGVSGLGGDRQLTNDSNQNIGPSWSPDGKLVAYHSVAQGGIWVVPIDGTTPRRHTQFGSAPAWSPDGGRIVFRSAEPISLAWFDVGGNAESTIWTIARDG